MESFFSSLKTERTARKAMAFCAGVSVLYSTAEHGSRCGKLTSRLALL